MRQQARRYSCSKENSKHPHIQATEKAGNEITNRHRNNPFSRHLSIALQPNKIHLHSNGWEAFEFLSVFHNFQRYKIAQRLRNVEVIHKEERNITHNHLFPAHFQTFYKFFRHGSDALPPRLPTTSKPESTHTHTHKSVAWAIGIKVAGEFLLRYQLQFISSSCLQRCLEGIQSLFSMGESESGLEVSGTQNSPINRPLWILSALPFPPGWTKKVPGVTWRVRYCKGQTHKKEGAWVLECKRNFLSGYWTQVRNRFFSLVNCRDFEVCLFYSWHYIV